MSRCPFLKSWEVCKIVDQLCKYSTRERHFYQHLMHHKCVLYLKRSLSLFNDLQSVLQGEMVYVYLKGVLQVFAMRLIIQKILLLPGKLHSLYRDRFIRFSTLFSPINIKKDQYFGDVYGDIYKRLQ